MSLKIIFIFKVVLTLTGFPVSSIKEKDINYMRKDIQVVIIPASFVSL